MSQRGATDRKPHALGFRRLAAPTLALLALTASALAQTWTAPPIPDDLKAAMAQADKGMSEPLVKLADSGRPDAQYYAANLFLFGRGGVAKDVARGCAYAEKASASRGDATLLSAECYRGGAGGAPDLEKAKAAYLRADAMGVPKAKCALGQMLLTQPGQAQAGIELCKTPAKAGDVEAQLAVAEAYFQGQGVKQDRGEARKWFDLAAKQNNPQAARKLGEMYASGDGGKKDSKKAMQLWLAAEKAGDPLVCILVADRLFADISGGRKPGPGQYAFKGGVPVADLAAIEEWYKEAKERDPRPDVKTRADEALRVLASLKSAANATPTVSKQKK